MFRNELLILLLASLALQTFERNFWVMDYYLDKTSFLKQCENKYRPQMHCNGQCLLMKKIKEQEAKEQQQPERKHENKIDWCAFQTNNSLTDLPVFNTRPAFAHFNEGKPLRGNRYCFRPPGAISA